jgi:Tfp pilus assembly protein PilF
MTPVTKNLLLVGAMLAVFAWSGLRIWSARTLSTAYQQSVISNRQSIEFLKETMEKMPAYKLTFLGAKLLRGGDYESAKASLEIATKKDRFYRDAFLYLGYVLQAMGDNDKAELALRRAKTLDPRISD